MNYTMMTANAATHVRILLVALMSSILIAWIGITMS
jgi:hypothetical protein